VRAHKQLREASFKHIAFRKFSKITKSHNELNASLDNLGTVAKATVIENLRDECHSGQAGAAVTSASRIQHIKKNSG
jgi:hypothetical protein